MSSSTSKTILPHGSYTINHVVLALEPHLVECVTKTSDVADDGWYRADGMITEKITGLKDFPRTIRVAL